MENRVTSIEQSRRLLELGVSEEKASIWWFRQKISPTQWGEWELVLNVQSITHAESNELFPAFTVAELLEILPIKIFCQDPFTGHLRIRRYADNNGCEWVVDYGDDLVIGRECLIDALIATIEWLKLSGYKLNV